MSKITETFPNNYPVRSFLALIVCGVAIFVTAASPLGFALRLLIALVILVAGLVFVLRRDRSERVPVPDPGDASHSEGLVLEEELSTLEDAAVYFSASMEPDEMLRLVAARLLAALPVSGIDFYLDDAANGIRSVSMAALRESAWPPQHLSHLLDLAASSFNSGKIERGDIEDVRAACVPLTRGDEVVSVLTLWTGSESELPDDALLGIVGVRVEPLIASSLSFASSVSNALTDNLTNLPNERAMYLILENQVAEAQRYGASRPLTILVMDIRSFDDFNRRYGHATGDRLLSFAGKLIREQLRNMDFLARTSDDEFVLILPTAESESSGNVRGRIESAFEAAPFEPGDEVSEIIRLNFGSATFGEDGDTSTSLIKSAIERKEIDKASIKGSVIRFPKPGS